MARIIPHLMFVNALQLACNELLLLANGVWRFSGQLALHKKTGSTTPCFHTTQAKF